MFIVGIDPGKNGGIVSLTNGKITTIVSMPANIDELWRHFLYLGFPNMLKKEDTHVWIEQVHSMPTDGHVGAFSFGHHLGILDTILDRLCFNVNRARPSTWMLYFGLRRQDKESKYDYKKRICDFARRKANSRKSAITLKTCDAFLIALYGYNQMRALKKSEGGK
jgi:crossover junction endodeoxyribonuclease RuvC